MLCSLIGRIVAAFPPFVMTCWMERTWSLGVNVMMSDITCLYCFVIRTDSLTFLVLLFVRSIEIFSGNEFIRVAGTVLSQVIEGNRMIWEMRGIHRQKGGLKGSVVEGTRSSVEGRCIGFWVQRYQLAILSMVPN